MYDTMVLFPLLSNPTTITDTSERPPREEMFPIVKYPQAVLLHAEVYSLVVGRRLSLEPAVAVSGSDGHSWVMAPHEWRNEAWAGTHARYVRPPSPLWSFRTWLTGPAGDPMLLLLLLLCVNGPSCW